jgi:glycosyltransferase involved in cell wall biosynthesis
LNIVCFGSVDWASHRQRPQSLMSAMVEQGHDVLYVENLGTRLPRPRDVRRVARRLANWLRTTNPSRPVADGRLRVDSPIVFPLQNVGWIRSIGRAGLVRRLRKRLPPGRPLIVWTYIAVPVVRDVATALGADVLVYDWSDDASEHVLTRSGRVKRRIAEWEDEMVDRADLVFVASSELLRRRGSPNPNTFVIPHGSHPPRRQGRALVPEVARSPRPRVGFVGSVTEWTDLQLIEHLARARPKWSFVIVGPVKTRVDGLRKRPNVIFTGERSHEEIPALLSSFDCAIIPYRLAPATQVASPVKLREYLAHGLPVVSVDVPEVHPFAPPVQIAATPAAFLAALDTAVPAGRRTTTPTHSRHWSDCAHEMVQHIDRLLRNGN